LQHVGRNCCHFFPDVPFQIQHCPWFLFIHLTLEISSEKEVLWLGILALIYIEVPTKYPLSQDRIVFENHLHSESPMLYGPALHGNWNAFSLARRALEDKFPMPTIPLTTVLKIRQVFLPDPVLKIMYIRSTVISTSLYFSTLVCKFTSFTFPFYIGNLNCHWHLIYIGLLTILAAAAITQHRSLAELRRDKLCGKNQETGNICHTGSVAASRHRTCLTYTWCCMYSLRLLMIDGKTVRNM
jgi:hypothetical protein